jgi:hypothetical protein
MSFAVVGSVELIRDDLCGPQQHNEHCKGWRWEMYVADNEKRHQAVMDELRRIHAERRAREVYAEAAE